MRAPPAVSWLVIDDRRWRLAQTLLWALAAASAGGWLSGRVGAGAPAFAAAAAAVAGAWLGWRTSRQPLGEIHWTGSQWRWCDAVGAQRPAAAPEVMLDLQTWMLLRLRLPDDGGRLWCSVARRPADAGAQWAAFRAAVYSAASRSDRRSGPESPLS